MRAGGAGGGPLGGEGSDEGAVDDAVEVGLGEVLRWLLLLLLAVVLLKAERGEREFGWAVVVVNWTDELVSYEHFQNKMDAEKGGKQFEKRWNESVSGRKQTADESRDNEKKKEYLIHVKVNTL